MSPEGSTVSFRPVPQHFGTRPIERFARKLETEITRGRPFECLITTDAELRRLNRNYRGQDSVTDVLSFPSPPVPLDRGVTRPLGSIAISLPRARAQAREFGHKTEQEIQILMLHGVLHLLGMDHETDAGRMARAEKRWRARLGLPSSLIERVQS
ncbi:MAG: rRNA maturation RNase YbeY [Terriglobia bacterium]|nr:MAG: rRNA maturation RNase YbeY [Terriglobia bacterium]